MAKELYKAGKIKDLCEDADFFTRLTRLEAQYPNASVLVHKQGVLPAEIADLWSSPQLMSAARQFLGGGLPENECTCQALYWCWGYIGGMSAYVRILTPTLINIDIVFTFHAAVTSDHDR